MEQKVTIEQAADMVAADTRCNLMIITCEKQSLKITKNKKFCCTLWSSGEYVDVYKKSFLNGFNWSKYSLLIDVHKNTTFFEAVIIHPEN